MIFWIAPVLFWLSGKAQGYVDFLRSIPSLIAPKPTPLGASYTPPFTGGQCVGAIYGINASREDTNISTGAKTVTVMNNGFEYQFTGAILGAETVYGTDSLQLRVLTSGGSQLLQESGWNSTFTRRLIIREVRRSGGLADSCGNLPDSSAAPSISDDGLFSPTNPLIADDNGAVNPAAIVLAPALPLILIPAILAGYGAALAAARAASDALEAVKKIAEGLESLKDLWEKLKEFLDEWEKNRPKKRDVVRQTYGQLVGDGALDFFPSNNQKYQSIQLDVVITAIPIGFGKFFGSFSPHRYRYKELGYIAFYSTTQGILEVRTLEFKRTSLQIPKLAVGFIYHLGLNDQIKGYAFGTFSIEKS